MRLRILFADAPRDSCRGRPCEPHRDREHSVKTASVSPMVATASAPTRATQNMSTTANSDSMHISSTMGIASRVMARPIAPA